MRILITGAGGLLGGRLCTLLANRHDVTGAIRNNAAPEGIATTVIDLVDEAAVAWTIAHTRPDVVIHSAALADPEICEREPDRAQTANVTATRILARACANAGTRLMALSTDLVFNGRTAFSTEDAASDPLSHYGRTKALAEVAALEEMPAVVIVRVALVIGRGHGARLTGSENIAQRLRRGETVTLYADEWRTPVDPESVASALEGIAERPELRGIFHVGGAERVSRLELGQRIAMQLGLDPSLIRSAERASHRGAPRAADVSLSITRAREDLGWTPRVLDEVLREGRT